MNNKQPMSNEDNAVYLNNLGIVNALGMSKHNVISSILAHFSSGMGKTQSPVLGKDFFVGRVNGELPEIAAELQAYDCRNNQLALAAAKQIESSIIKARETYTPERIGVVVGTSTSGVAETELAFVENLKSNKFPENYHYKKQEAGSLAEFLAKSYGLKGPSYVISTACSSSGKVFASARGLIQMGICDAVVVGGADSLCELTLSGFSALEAMSAERSNPFSINRCGINVGEAAALFLMSKEPGLIQLAGVGESSDAHHISAPEPSGIGAQQAMLAALLDAGLQASQIGYVNAHGTGTRLNDSMESQAIFSVFGDTVLTSSTKPLTGHTLGASGATEAGICWLLLNQSDHRSVAAHLFDGKIDPQLRQINLTTSCVAETTIKYAMSNSFAFGGNNVSVILGRNDA